MHSQIILKPEPNIRAVIVNDKPFIIIDENDGKIILTDLLQKIVLDSLVNDYKITDSLKDIKINLQDTFITCLKIKTNSQQEVIQNLNIIIRNKDEEISVLNGTILKQKSEIKKQKTYKIIGITAAIVLPILAIIFL